MTTIFLMRHAKSDWSGNLPDFDRPLNKRGIKSAGKMGKWLHDESVSPELVICSPARRTSQTVEIICKELNRSYDEVIQDKRIYEAGLEDLLDVISDHSANAESLLLVGHNPGMDALVRYLSRDTLPYTDSGKLMTTAAIAILKYEKGFTRKPGSGKMIKLVRPKEI